MFYNVGRLQLCSIQEIQVLPEITHMKSNYIKKYQQFQNK